MENETMTTTGTINITKGANFATETAEIWNSCNFGMEMQEPNVLNCDSDKLTNSFFNQNWDNSMDQCDPFESALSSIVSSPVASHGASVFHTNNVNGVGDSVMIRELIGRLGNISSSNSGDVSPPMSYTYNDKTGTTNNASCYSTPLNSPPKLNLSILDSQIGGNFPTLGSDMVSHPSLAPLQANPGFAERAAMYSCFGGRNLASGGLNGQLGRTTMLRAEPEKAARVSSHKTISAANGSKVNIVQESCRTSLRGKNSEFGDSREGSSVSEQIPGGELGLKPHNDGNSRKRKLIPRGKTKETPSSSDAIKATAENDESNAKRSKPDDTNEEQKNVKQKQNNKKDDSKPPEPPKDYIHVRARRGQATDSHSLAERVRREKISERMKFLQDLVPGCNKVTGKAVMLDEIINYVQSLQRQVEFLSMKLATVNPKMNFNMESLLSKDTLHSHGLMPRSLDSSVGQFPYGYQALQGFPLHDGMACDSNTDTQFSVVNPLTVAMLRRDSSVHLPPMNDGLRDVSGQVTAFWDEDLQSVVQMGFGQNQEENYHGKLDSPETKNTNTKLNLPQPETNDVFHAGLIPSNQMKIEL